MIYLDHNATTPLDEAVLQAMLPHLREGFGNPSSPHRVGAGARAALEGARQRVAACLGCGADEVVFCGSGTEADNLALQGAARAAAASRGGVGARRGVVTTAVEHHAVMHTCSRLGEDGFAVTRVGVGADGVVDLRALEAALDEGTVLVSVMHANNETGVVQPVAEVAGLVRERTRSAVVHVDAVQTAGKLPGRLADLGADLVAISGHKLYGPKGVGALYVKRGTPLAPVITGGGQERGLRSGTEDVAGAVGLAAALELATARVEVEGAREAALRDRFERAVLAAVPGVRVNGALAPRVPNTSSLSLPGVDGESVVLGMDLAGFCVSTGSACSTGESEPSHVLRAMGRSAQEAGASIRVSLGRSTTEADVDGAAAALAATVRRLQAVSSI